MLLLTMFPLDTVFRRSNTQAFSSKSKTTASTTAPGSSKDFRI
ncbi:MAG: hypothetical protein U5Q03_06545 [Bacteroidota bacterium]|nr:hypothetical protein [Bacteroidota bacterium]